MPCESDMKGHYKMKYKNIAEEQKPPELVLKKDVFYLLSQRYPTVKDSDVAIIDAFENKR